MKKLSQKIKAIRERNEARLSRLLSGKRHFLRFVPVQAIIISFLLMLYIEGFGYGSASGGFEFLRLHPGAFICNMLFLFSFLSFAWLFRQRIFFYTVISVLWLLLGTTNGIILLYRMTPFTTADLEIIDMGLDILPSYLSTGQLVLVGIAFAAAAALFVLVWLFAPRAKKGGGLRILRKRASLFAAAIALSILALFAGQKTGALDTYFENLWDAYARSGMPYGFLSTWLNKGIDRPKDYSEERIAQILAAENNETDAATDSAAATQESELPNFIFLQLESFIDPDETTKYEFSEAATPFFKELKENFSSGYLRVPVIGGGTANTEFEVMTGMSLRFFGPGEYPYKSVLTEKTCETMAYNLKELGYKTHAIHNHRGAFYARNKVFANLGFDDFTSLEYMNYVAKTPKNYAKDDVLQGQIVDAMKSTSEKDYIYCISVQGHGEYPKTALVQDPPVTVLGDVDAETKNALEYYVTQMREMDDFLRLLTEELSEYPEPVVLVLYGDHLPALGMTDEDMRSGSAFDTEYVIWTNFEMEREKLDLAAYQLAAEVQERVGMSEGTLTRFHQAKEGDADYSKDLELLEYDILYGKRYVYGEDGTSPFAPTDLQMGFSPIRVSEIKEVAGEYYIVGEGFTPYSKVSLDGEILETVFLGPTLLKLEQKIDTARAADLRVSQVEKYDAILSTTE